MNNFYVHHEKMPFVKFQNMSINSLPQSLANSFLSHIDGTTCGKSVLVCSNIGTLVQYGVQNRPFWPFLLPNLKHVDMAYRCDMLKMGQFCTTYCANVPILEHLCLRPNNSSGNLFLYFHIKPQTVCSNNGTLGARGFRLQTGMLTVI